MMRSHQKSSKTGYLRFLNFSFWTSDHFETAKKSGRFADVGSALQLACGGGGTGVSASGSLQQGSRLQDQQACPFVASAFLAFVERISQVLFASASSSCRTGRHHGTAGHGHAVARPQTSMPSAATRIYAGLACGELRNVAAAAKVKPQPSVGMPKQAGKV